MQAASLRFSPALWRRGRGANLKPRLSQAASLATERPPRNMRLSLHPSLPREVNIQATEVTETLPQALKRNPGPAELLVEIVEGLGRREDLLQLERQLADDVQEGRHNRQAQLHLNAFHRARGPP